MSEAPAISVERVVQPLRDACEAALAPAVQGIARADVICAEVRRVGAQCSADLEVMAAGVREGSAVVTQARAAARAHREEERPLDTRLDELEGELGVWVERARNHAARERAVAEPAADHCRSARHTAESLAAAAAAASALNEIAVAATDAVGAAADRLRAFARQQG